MNSAQITAFQPPTLLCGRRNIVNDCNALKPSNLSFPCSGKTNLILKCSNRTLMPRRSSFIVCSSDSGAGSQGSPWKAFENALGKVTRGQSIEDVLKQQIQKKEYFSPKGDGGDGGGGNGGDDGGGGGADGDGDGDGSGGTEDEGLKGILDEILQVFLATLGFIVLYIYIITGEELMKLAKDYLKYVFKGVESVRLKKVKSQWRDFWDSLKPIEVEEDPFWLEREIINTPTWFDSPEKYHRIFGDSEETSPSESYKKSDAENDAESYPEDDYY